MKLNTYLPTQKFQWTSILGFGIVDKVVCCIIAVFRSFGKGIFGRQSVTYTHDGDVPCIGIKT